MLESSTRTLSMELTWWTHLPMRPRTQLQLPLSPRPWAFIHLFDTDLPSARMHKNHSGAEETGRRDPLSAVLVLAFQQRGLGRFPRVT